METAKKWLLAVGFCLFMIPIFTSCSDATDSLIDEPSETFDNSDDTENSLSETPCDPDNVDDLGTQVNVMKRLAQGEMALSYTGEEFALYEKDERTDWKWQNVDLYEIVGFSFSIPGKFHIENGKSWEPYSFFNLVNINSLAFPWEAYCRVTKTNKELYIATDIEYDYEAATIKIGDKLCSLLWQNEEKIRISYESPYWYGHDGNGNWEEGLHKEVGTYMASELTLADKENVLYYDSEKELFIDIIAKIRAKFGNEFNLNDYLYPDIILDYPMVNLDEIEKELFGE